jgi:hypothetical protein
MTSSAGETVHEAARAVAGFNDALKDAMLVSYRNAGEPYGANQIGCLRWLREQGCDFDEDLFIRHNGRLPAINYPGGSFRLPRAGCS